jgi:farnesyl diphosphate synthase
MGGIIVGLEDETIQKLYDFGIDIGLLFQIQDDIIDETATALEAGKTTSNDGAKNSFVNLLGLVGAIKSADSLALKCEETINSFETTIQNSLLEILSRYLYRHKK